MLTVQINYNTLQESIRHNMAMELQARNELAETRRHNIVYENETMRHNIASETIEQGKLQETIRHNTQTEAIGWYEAETTRNLANSQIALNRAKTAAQELETAYNVMYGNETRQSEINRNKSQTVSNLANAYSTMTATNISKATTVANAVDHYFYPHIEGRGASTVYDSMQWIGGAVKSAAAAF